VEHNKLIKYDGGQLQKVGNAITVTNKLLGLNTKKYKVIHVDDHNVVLRGVKHLIEENLPNVHVDSFQYTSDALEYIQDCLKLNRELDLILTDMSMPKMNGYEFALEAKSATIKHNKKIPILLITIHSDEYSPIKEGLLKGVFDKYFGIGSDPSELISTIKGLLNF